MHVVCRSVGVRCLAVCGKRSGPAYMYRICQSARSDAAPEKTQKSSNESGGIGSHKFMFRATLRAMVKVGDRIPAVNLHEGFGPPKMVSLSEFTKGRKTVIVGLPGAFTPT